MVEYESELPEPHEGMMSDDEGDAVRLIEAIYAVMEDQSTGLPPQLRFTRPCASLACRG